MNLGELGFLHGGAAALILGLAVTFRLDGWSHSSLMQAKQIYLPRPLSFQWPPMTWAKKGHWRAVYVSLAWLMYRQVESAGRRDLRDQYHMLTACAFTGEDPGRVSGYQDG